jgi:hypothetical protein
MKKIAIACVVIGALCSGPHVAFTSVDAQTEQPSQRPAITKKGTIDQDLCETTPFVFQGRVYRLEWFRKGSILRVVEHKTGRELSRFGEKHRFACAYVEGDTVYVVGTKETAEWCGNVLTMFTSRDLTHWDERPAFTLDGGSNICNTSVCRVGDRYVMSIEMTKPSGFPARFIESKDLLTWTLMPPECKHSLGRYNAAHCLRWHNGWFYLFYLEAGKPNGYEQYITRSRDLITWHTSPLNPVLAASPQDKQIANPRLTPKQRNHIAKAADVNNSDIDFCEFNGRLIINYSWGNQGGTEFIAEAEFDGTTAQFLEGWFPDAGTGQTH